MDNENEPPKLPRSRAVSLWRSFRAWLRQWILWDERPSPQAYRSVSEHRDQLLITVRNLQVQLLEAKAMTDACKREIEILAAVVVRNEERVKSESAHATAEREAYLSKADTFKQARSAT